MHMPYNFSEWPWIPDSRQTVVLLSREGIPRKIFGGLSDVDLGRPLSRLFIGLKLRPKKSSFDSVKKLGESHAVMRPKGYGAVRTSRSVNVS